MAEHRGIVAWFNNTRGFGFITDGNGNDIFCHYTAIETEGYKRLKSGASVTFDVEAGRQGKPQAARVKVLPECESDQTTA